MGQSTRRLVVARGLNVGAQLIVNHDVKLVGRARDANLVLTDRGVSRHHFHVVASEQGARVHVCADAAPFLHGGREVREAVVKVGESIVVGDTVLVVTDAADVDDLELVPAYGGHVTTSVRTLMTGMASDVHGLSAVFALDEALCAVHDLPSIEATLETWARVHAECESARLTLASDITVPVDVAVTADVSGPSDGSSEIVEWLMSNGRVTIRVPVYGMIPRWLTFTTVLPKARITLLLRRLLVVAGRVCASRLVQLSLLAVKEECESLRRQTQCATCRLPISGSD